jgi:hypothetical protein
MPYFRCDLYSVPMRSLAPLLLNRLRHCVRAVEQEDRDLLVEPRWLLPPSRYSIERR